MTDATPPVVGNEPAPLPIVSPQLTVPEALALPAPGRIHFSAEFMPPRDDAAELRLTRAAETFHDLGVSFVSVTYGAGGSSRDRTMRIARHLVRTPLTTIAHLTLVNHTADELADILEGYVSCGIANILALRGDPPGDPLGEWTPIDGGFTYASELISFIRERYSARDIAIGIAAFPEGHYRASSLEEDTAHTVAKLRAGADYSITQMFFDVEHYLRLRDRIAALDPEQGEKPIIPGLMPITSLRSVRRQMELAGAALPRDLEERLVRAADGDEEKNRDAIRSVGIEITTEMAERLIAEGAPDLHFMTMNFARATQEVLYNLGMAPAWGQGHGQDAVR